MRLRRLYMLLRLRLRLLPIEPWRLLMRLRMRHWRLHKRLHERLCISPLPSKARLQYNLLNRKEPSSQTFFSSDRSSAKCSPGADRVQDKVQHEAFLMNPKLMAVVLHH